MKFRLGHFLLWLVSYSALPAFATVPDGYRFAHGGPCSSQEIAQGYRDYSYWRGGKDGGMQREVCLRPEANGDLVQD